MTGPRYATYGAELAAAWAQHTAPRTPDAPTVVSLFAGAGGSSLGYSMAGYRELLTVEWDAHAVACMARNLPDVRIHHGDITTLSPAVLGLEPGQLDVLDGSPPCQGFSISGSRQLDDPRNQLFRHYVRLRRAWQPRAFVIENVAGMVTGKMKAIFAEVMAELRESGYQVTARLLVASYYRVPQRRPRVIFVGTRNDLGIPPSHPAPISAELTVGYAFADLADPGILRPVTIQYARLMPFLRPGEDGGSVLGRYGKKPSFFGLSRLRTDAPSTTIMKSSAGMKIHPEYNRVIGTREMARLCSFPDAYDWGPSGYTEIQARLGNSVPPLMMRAIALHLRGLLTGHTVADRVAGA